MSPAQVSPVSLQVAFGLAVRARREVLGLSQEALGDLAHLHRTYVGSVERGERNVSIKNIFSLAAALNTLSSTLMSDAEVLLALDGGRAEQCPSSQVGGKRG